MYDLSPLYRSTVGFDRLAQMLGDAANIEAPSYPPYNIERLDENDYRITMAVAGFATDDLEIEVKQNTLRISGKKSDKPESKDVQFLHQGIAARSFERRFQLADHVEITSAELENGLLHIALKRELPEAMKPRTIAISDSAKGKSKPRTIEGKAA